MSDLRRQALSNTLIIYFGIALGAVNTLLLYPRLLEADEIGLVRILNSVGLLYIQLAGWGMPGAIPRFFPYFRTDDGRHKGMIALVGTICVAGFGLVSLMFLVLKPLVVEQYDRAPLFIDYYLLAIPLSGALLAMTVADTMLAVVQRTVYAAFLREVLLRLLSGLAVGLHALDLIDFNAFVIVLTALHGLIALLLLLSVARTRKYALTVHWREAKWADLRGLLKYGGYTVLTGAAVILAQSLDQLMLAKYIGLAIVGVYTTYLFMATVMTIPYRAITRVLRPVLAEAWAQKDRDRVARLYANSSLVLLISGSLLYVLVLVNRHNLMAVLPAETFAPEFGVFVWLGLGALIDMTGGMNSVILPLTDKYRWDFFFNLLLVGVAFVTNLIFIPRYGGAGAALATAITFLALNILKWWFLLHHYGLQPFGWRHLLAAGIALATFGVGYALPILPIWWLDAGIRSGLITGLFLGLTLGLKVSPSLNERAIVYRHKALTLLGRK